MKILAIRGSNLASLAGEFEIDLARAPLSDAGVFAITGNTGAGKSTLLDALCVALFDRTPRLTNHSRVTVGRGDHDPATLGAHDVRTLLRRGAATGYAEVDFEAGDARRYRARWAVRRARDRADGTLQDQTLSLTALDSTERLGGTKTETLKAISSRLGLTFDQFRRSALLAQGEFAAFLRADGKDRSELLERMTGTEIYTRLSIAAHLRATQAEQHLRDTRAAALAIPILADDARVASDAACVLASDVRRAARQRLDAAEAAARWLAESAARSAALRLAEADRVAATDAQVTAEADRAELALRQRAARLQVAVEDVLRLEAEHAACGGSVGELDQAAAAVEAERANIGTHQGVLLEIANPLRAARAGRSVEPTSSAHVGTNRLRTGADATGAVISTHEREGVESLGKARAGGSDPTSSAHVGTNQVRNRCSLDGLDARIATGDAARIGRAARPDAEWLLARAALGPEIAGWDAIAERFTEHASIAAVLVTIDRAIAGHVRDRASLDASRALVATDLRGAQTSMADAQRTLQTFHDRRGTSLDAARKREDEARTRLTDADRLIAIVEAARTASILSATIDRELAELVAVTEVDRAHSTELHAELPRTELLRDERTRALDELRRAAGYTHARAELVDGEPCPLCGAAEHPWRDRGALDDVIAAALSTLDETIAQAAAQTAALAAIEGRAAQRERDRVMLRARRDHATAAHDAARIEWRGHLSTTGELILDDDPSSPAADQLATERATTARKQLEAARDARHQTEAVAKAAADAQARVELARADVDQLAARVVELDRGVAEIEAAAERLRGERRTRHERLHDLGWSLKDLATRWLRIDALDRIDAPHRIDAQDRDAPTRLELEREQLTGLVSRWHARFGHVAAAGDQVERALHQLDIESRELERAATEHATRLAETTRLHGELAAKLAAATRRFDLQCEEVGLAASELAAGETRRIDVVARLVRDQARTLALTERLARIDAAAARTSTIFDERQQIAIDHETTRPDPAALTDGAEIERVAAQLAAAETELARAASVIAADVDARRRRDLAFAVLATDEQRVEIDRVLGGVIGSHDGKLFRSFAQSLTLDGLLAVANAHLDELAPRYQLERIPRHDLEIQVIDRDLGDEVRSVQSLSGGEGFLVSLALALGLSSMSAHDVRVRTLLIDEGFGTLDPTTLDAALATLDALQATGRQIGVISHVPALVERVGAHVKVVQRGGGRSDVVVRA